jgi:hypothetical protein
MKETVGATRNISALLSFAVARFGTAEETVGATRNMSALLSFAAARFGTAEETVGATQPGSPRYVLRQPGSRAQWKP